MILENPLKLGSKGDLLALGLLWRHVILNSQSALYIQLISGKFISPDYFSIQWKIWRRKNFLIFSKLHTQISKTQICS